jgi:hypothetical protein
MSKKIEKQKMATITEVYNRIVWDAQLNRNMFIDRTSPVQTKLT